MRQDAGRRHSPLPVSSNQYTSASDIVPGSSSSYSTHSVLPFSGHQWKNELELSRDDRGSFWSFTARGFRPPLDVVTLARDAIVGTGSGRALAGRLGIQTAISPGPRLAQA